MISMQEIAEKIGVSRNTVSKVLNNKEGVSDAVRKSILQTASEMGYPKLPANIEETGRVLSGQKNISVLVTNPEFSQYWMHLLNAIANELNKTGYNLIYNYIYNNGQGTDNVSEIIDAGNFAGIIVINVYDSSIIKKIAGAGLPTVYSDIPMSVTCSEAKGDIILFEGQHSIAKITEHMLSQGIKKIGFIGDITYARTIYERWLGFQLEVLNYGIKLDMDYCLIKGVSNHFYNPGEVEQSLSQLKNLPDAFVCANDVIAYMAIKYFESKGIRVPEDMIVSGYDNIKESIINDNRLTTVEANVEYLGKCLVRQLFDLIKDPSRPYETVFIETNTIFRNSTNSNFDPLRTNSLR